MENVMRELNEKSHELLLRVTQLQDYLQSNAIPVPRGVRQSFVHFQKQYDALKKFADSGLIDECFQAAQNTALFAKQISSLVRKIENLNDESKLKAQEISEAAERLRKVEDDPSLFQPIQGESPSRNFVQTTFSLGDIKKVEQIISDQEKHDERIRRGFTEYDMRLAEVRGQLDDLENKLKTTIDRTEEKYSQALIDIGEKTEQINLMLGHSSGRVIAGDYEGSAASEKSVADSLRLISLSCMALIAAVLGYSFWETTVGDFDWQKSLFRVALAFLLSAPAAYLARESSKHRAQQYRHHQISLDLKAISPYLASLPDDVQHRIKAEVAAKLFAGKDFSHLESELYPINSHELLMELAKRLPRSAVDEKV